MKNLNLVLMAAVIALTCFGGSVQAAGNASNGKPACAHQQGGGLYAKTNSPPGEARVQSAIRAAYISNAPSKTHK